MVKQRTKKETQEYYIISTFKRFTAFVHITETLSCIYINISSDQTYYSDYYFFSLIYT
jgi:hypothetical protein